MLEMLKTRREQLQERGKSGFTLMEMLIVIAIIAILIAIAIPIFSSQLDAANKATDEANIRSGYAQVQTEIMLNNVSNGTYILQDDATVSATSTANDYKAKSSLAASDNVKIGGRDVTTTKDSTITYTVTNGEVSAIGPTA